MIKLLKKLWKKILGKNSKTLPENVGAETVKSTPKPQHCGSHKIVSRVSTTIAQAGQPSTVTQYNSFTLTLPSAASTTETGGGINCVVGPVNQRRA